MNLEEKTRKKYKWEFLRRNKDYIEDYLRYKDDNSPPPADLWHKWHHAMIPDPGNCWKLADPEISNPALELFEAWDPPVRSEFIDNRGLLNKVVSLVLPGSEAFGKKWGVYDQKRKTAEELNQDNCPEWLTVSIRILPHYQKTKAIKIFMQEFKKQLALLLKAQRSIRGAKPPRPRVDLYDEYLEIYDLHAKKKWTFEKIARKCSPIEFRSFKESLNSLRVAEPDNAIRQVRYAYGEAKRMIKEGWRYL